MENTVGIRELKSQLSAYLRKVKNGDSITITEHGKPIGQIVPMPQTDAARTQALIDAGLISWSGRKLQPLDRSSIARLNPDAPLTVSQLLLSDRE